MPSDCVFEFDRRDPIYYSGETINGRIKLRTTRPKNVNGNNIYISMSIELIIVRVVKVLLP